MDECFSEIQVNDKVYYFNTKLQECSGKALMRGPAGWVVVIEGGDTVVATTMQVTQKPRIVRRII